jgi:DNA-binding MarR family transcriptional regulator
LGEGRGTEPGWGPGGNVLGALALALTDRMSEAVTAAAGVSETGAIALSALHHYLDGASLDLLGRVLGLTPSGAVRLVDRLVEAGHVRRTRGADARSTSVRLTAAGRRAARRVSAARASVLVDALAPLAPEQRRQLEALAGRMLAGLVRAPGATRWTCRLCDTGSCDRPEARCPLVLATGRAAWANPFDPSRAR